MKYEYNIEDIVSAEITDLRSDNKYTIMFKRKDDENFIQTFYAGSTYTCYDMGKEQTQGTISSVCERCGEITTQSVIFDMTGEQPEPISDDNGKAFKINCNYCTDDYELLIGESDVREILLESFNDESLSVVINEEELVK